MNGNSANNGKPTLGEMLFRNIEQHKLFEIIEQHGMLFGEDQTTLFGNIEQHDKKSIGG